MSTGAKDPNGDAITCEFPLSEEGGPYVLQPVTSERSPGLRSWLERLIVERPDTPALCVRHGRHVAARTAMPSTLHEALLQLFRDRPVLAPVLMRDALGLSVPEFSEAKVDDANLSSVTPTEYRADLVILLRNGAPVLGIVLEAQLSPDQDKLYSWPAYAAELRGRMRCPCCVLVITVEPSVAAWADRDIEIGPAGSVFRPLVLWPKQVPIVTDVEQARRLPELAVMSARAHGEEAVGREIAVALYGALGQLDPETARLYFDLVMAGLNEGARRALEELMASGNYEPQSAWAKKWFEDGRAEGKAEGEAKGEAKGELRAKREVLLKIFAGRGLAVSEDEHAKVLGCSDLPTLDRWIERAFQVTSVQLALGD